MAIDMIENSELSALAGSRLGMKNFADDNSDYMNLFGSKKRDYAERATETLKSKLSTDCDKIDESIAIIEADIAANIKRSATEKASPLKKTKLAIQEAQSLLGEYKKIKVKNCAKIEDIKKEKDEAIFQDTLKKIADESVIASQKDIAGTTIVEKIKNNKPLVIGGAIIVLGLAAFLMFKKK